VLERERRCEDGRCGVWKMNGEIGEIPDGKGVLGV